ncbi:protein of unknown function [Desulfatibacillum alkenivorans DSM 16219]|jgi:membrane protein implicated in regulation of membrane protease activity|uniref:Uncharacterized protein n=1 Tax=Desulfatibacillum alkenivorans DSM 16219 TaxID=1121393 RepID=A0A1M6DTJ4_9BACT|nr:DUF4272 domain-containing protein [Desulfatibacillum alkenivorans]SHI76566.1 protein of unknown function [Desulfatibacillum alkenivorans DSM 16219]
MPQPLKAKRVDTTKSNNLGCLILLASGAGAGYLAYLWFAGRPFAYSSAPANFLAHALLVIVPGLMVYNHLSIPVEFENPPGEILIEDATYLTSLKTDWWMSLMLWPPVLLGALFTVLQSLAILSGASSDLPTQPYSALFTAFLSLGLFFFFGNVIKLKAPFYVGEEGLRAGVSFFLEWDEIDHMQEKQGVFLVYTVYNPKLPIASLRPFSSQALQALLEMLNQKQVKGMEQTPPALAAVQVVIFLAFSAMTALGLALWMLYDWDPRWVIVFLFVLGVLFSLALERFRGVHKLTRIKPEVGGELQNARAVARRALCLAVMVKRGRLEIKLRKSQARGNESIHKEINELYQWVKDNALYEALADSESALLRRMGGTWSQQEAGAACWRNEALGTLLWALGAVEEIPPYDHPFEWEDLSQKLPVPAAKEDFPAPDPVGLFLHKAVIKDPEEIANARELAELWHWRARTTQIMEQGVEAPEGFSFEQIISQAANAAYTQNEIPQPLGGDFPVFGKAYASLGPEELQLAASIARERHLALNWLCMYAEDWDSTPTDT